MFFNVFLLRYVFVRNGTPYLSVYDKDGNGLQLVKMRPMFLHCFLEKSPETGYVFFPLKIIRFLSLDVLGAFNECTRKGT